jgi:hypothetical protein
VQVCGVRSGRAILLTTVAGIAIGIELQLARQIWLWLRTGSESAGRQRNPEPVARAHLPPEVLGALIAAQSQRQNEAGKFD